MICSPWMKGLYPNWMYKIRNIIQKYNHDKFWKMREYVCLHNSQKNLKSFFYLFRLKRIEALHLSSTGVHLGARSAYFLSPPILPHGLNNIIISNEAIIGKNVIIYHNVTIGGAHLKSPTIGDNVEIGTGAIIIGGIHIGNNVKIGAGCIVCENIPDNCTVVMHKPRIIMHSNNLNEIV